jgi:4'-phosphopantetheinyl transferase
VRILWLAQSERDLPEGPDWLTPFERERAEGMRFAKRRTDYLLARWVGKRAVALALGHPLGAETLARIAIVNAEDGAPEARFDGVPAPVGISLSDRAGWGVCAVGVGDAPVGCDLELVEPRSRRFVADYFTAAERAWVDEADDAARDARANLVWCAKESALKVLRTGLRRDTRDVEVETAGRGQRDWEPLRVRVRAGEGAVYPGWWHRFGPFLLSVAAARPAPPPVSLCDPPGLLAAEPFHSWMERPLLFAKEGGAQRGAT